MIFYTAPGSPLLHPTQAAAGKGFVQHDVPTDKTALMAYINELLERELAPAPAPAPTSELRPGEDCITCRRSAAASAAMAGLVDMRTVIQFLGRIENKAHLRGIKAHIEEKLQ